MRNFEVLVKPVRRRDLAVCLHTLFRSNPAPPIAEPGPSASAGSSGKRVLVAEDHPVNQRVAKRLLEKEGHCVTVANNGREAVEAVARQAFDLILMDVQMPEMDGYEATAAIRGHDSPLISNLPIVAVTAHAINGNEERCLKAGMNGFVTKPVDPAKLRSAIELALNRTLLKSEAQLAAVAE